MSNETNARIATLYQVPFPDDAAQGDRLWGVLSKIPMTYMMLRTCSDSTRQLSFATFSPDEVNELFSVTKIPAIELPLLPVPVSLGSIQTLFYFLNQMIQEKKFVTGLMSVPSNFAKLRFIFACNDPAQFKLAKKIFEDHSKLSDQVWKSSIIENISLLSFALPRDNRGMSAVLAPLANKDDIVPLAYIVSRCHSDRRTHIVATKETASYIIKCFEDAGQPFNDDESMRESIENTFAVEIVRDLSVSGSVDVAQFILSLFGGRNIKFDFLASFPINLTAASSVYGSQQINATRVNE